MSALRERPGAEDGRPEVPAVAGNSAAAAGFKLKHRQRAILADVIEEGMTRPAARKRLLAQFEEDPLRFLERVNAMCPADPVEPKSSAPALGFNIGQLFLAAAQQRQPEPRGADLIDVVPIAGTDGVQW